MPKYAAKVMQKLQAATRHGILCASGQRRFPVRIWLRKPEEIDHLVEADIFQDFFGHAPLLFDPAFADFLQLTAQFGGLPRLRLLARYRGVEEAQASGLTKALNPSPGASVEGLASTKT